MKVKNRNEADEFAQMYNAVVIKEIKTTLIEKEPKKSKFKQAGETSGFDMRGIK